MQSDTAKSILMGDCFKYKVTNPPAGELFKNCRISTLRSKIRPQLQNFFGARSWSYPKNHGSRLNQLSRFK